MKKSFFICLCSLLSVLVVTSCTSNKNIKDDVEKVLTASYPGVSVSVNDDVVTLTGTVDTNEQRMAAENAAKSVNHVKSVINNIEVKQTSNVTQDADMALRNSLRSAYTAAGYNDVMVAVNDGEVTLTGTVNRANLERVMQIANDAGPKRVTNNLTIE